MRRLVLLALLLGLVAVATWWHAEGARTASDPGGRAHRAEGADEAARALLRGTPPPGGTGVVASDAKPRPAEVAEPPSWPYGTITGRVVGPGGVPVPDATVVAVGVQRLYREASGYSGAKVDAEGRFALPAWSGLATVVTATAPGHCVGIGPRVLLAEGAFRDVGTLTLAREQTIAVRVIDEAGAPIPDVEVRLESEADPPPEGWESVMVASGVLASRATGDQGRVSFDKLPEGTWRVVLDSGDAAAGDQVREHVEAGGEEEVFVVSGAAVPETFRLRLKVLGPDGRPVPSVRAYVGCSNCANSDRILADAAALLELDGALGTVSLVVSDARDEAGAPLALKPFLLRDARTLASPAVVTMAPGETITGHVHWEGEPTTWTVHATGWLDLERGVSVPWDERGDGWSLFACSSQTDAAGAFRLVGLAPGRYGLRATGIGRMHERGPVVEAGATDVVLKLVPEGKLEVRILPPPGTSFGDAALVVEEWVGLGLRGKAYWSWGGGDAPDVRIFQVDDLRVHGHYQLRAWGTCSGLSCPPTVLNDVVPRAEPYVVQLRTGPHVTGVVEREDGSPVWGLQIHPRPWPGGELDRFQHVGGLRLGFVRTDAQGAFDLGGLDEGDILLTATGQGLVLRDGPLRVRSPASGVRLVAVVERRISGRLSDPAGGAVDGLRVTAVPERGRPTLWTPQGVSADGFFEIRGLAPGAYLIAAWNEEDPTDARSVLSDAVPAGRHDVRLALRPGPVLEGVVRDAAGRPIQGASVRVLGPWTNRTRRTDAKGRIAFAGLPFDVELEVVVASPAGLRTRRKVRLRGTEAPTVLDVTLPGR